MDGEQIEPQDSASDDEDASSEPPSGAPDKPAVSRKRGRRFLAGVILGTLAGAACAALLGKQGDSPAGPLVSPEALQDAPGGASGGLFSSLRTKWREASAEARLAAREAEARKRARFLELTELEDRR